MPLFDYFDVIYMWCPTTAKLTSVVERLCTRFVKKLPLSFCSRFFLMERRRFHTAVQIFKSLQK